MTLTTVTHCWQMQWPLYHDRWHLLYWHIDDKCSDHSIMIGDTYRGDTLVTTAVTTQSSYVMRCLITVSVKPPASLTLALPCSLLRALNLFSAPFPSALSGLSAALLPDMSPLSLSVTVPWTSVTRCGRNYNKNTTTFTSAKSRAVIYYYFIIIMHFIIIIII